MARGRPRLELTRQVSFMVTPDLFDRMETLLSDRMIDRSTFLRHALESALEKAVEREYVRDGTGGIGTRLGE